MRLIWGTIFLLIGLIAAVGGWWVFVSVPETRILTVAAGRQGSDSHVLMKEVSEVLIRHSKTLRLNIVESRSSSDSISQINRGEIDLATIQSNTPAYTSINVVADLFTDYFLLISQDYRTAAEQGRNFDQISGIRKKRIAIPESGTEANLSFWSVVDHYKVPPEGFSSVATPRQKGVEQFLAGNVDAIFLVSSLRDPELLSFIGEAGLRGIPIKFIAINQAEAMTLKRPYLKSVRIVKGAFDGHVPLPKEDVATPSLNRLLVTAADTDEELIHELVRVIFENRLDLLIRMALSSSIQDPRQEGVATLPLHPGAARFFDRDKPSFLQENAEPMALIVTLIAMIISAMLALRRSLQARAKNQGDRYNDQLLRIAERARANADPEELQEMKDELVALLERAVRALDTDKITEEGFQSFAFIWGSTKDTVNERLRRARAEYI